MAACMTLVRALICAVLLCGEALAQTVAPTWTRANEIYINTGPPRQYIGPLFSNSYTGEGPLAGTWQTVDLVPWGVGADAVAAFMNGILIITSGTTHEVNDLGVVFRALGDTSTTCTAPNYTGQTVFQNSGNPGGQRSNMSSWIPVIGGKVEWCWYRSTTGQWPVSASYGVNLSVQAWAR